MEEMHKKLIHDLQQQHQNEVAKLLKEKDQLLKEETAATMAAIVAMRRAHKEELEKTRHSQNMKENAEASQLQIEYEKELQSLNKDLEVLSVQHTQKCLENSQLSQELQELKKKKREADDTASVHPLKNKQVRPDGPDLYEMEVILRAREAEMQFLRQEAKSLKEELKLARMDTIYAQNKLKTLCMGTPDEKLLEDLNKCATWSPGKQETSQMLSEAVTNKDVTVENKTGRLSISRRLRAVRSKSLREGLSVQERMRLFES